MEQISALKKTESLTIRLTKEDKSKIEANALSIGIYSVSDYIRMVALNADVKVEVNK